MTHEILRTGRGLVIALFLSATPAAFAADKTGTAADAVPSDCAFFGTSLRIKERMDAFCQSNAVKKARNSQIGKMIEAQIRMNLERGEGKQFTQFLESPVGKDVLKMLHSAGKDEIFFYGDKGWGEIINFLNEMNFANSKAEAAAMGKGERKPKQLTSTLELLMSKNPKVPSIVFGFKFSEFETMNRYLDNFMQMTSMAPVRIQTETLKLSSGDIRTISIAGSAVPKEQFLGHMKDETDEKTATAFYDWFSKQTFTICIGKWNDYLVISFGADSKPVERLGTGVSIANSADFEPVKKHLTGKVNSIGYVSADFLSKIQMNPDEMLGGFEKMLDDVKDKLPEGLAPRLKSDLKRIGPKVAGKMPKPSAVVSVDVENRGSESFTYSKSPSSMLDYSKPLTILQRAGKDAMLAIAVQSPSNKGDYEDVAEFGKLIWGYWTDFGIKQLPPDAAEIAKKLEGPVLNFIKRLDSINRTKLMPATDAGQSLFVIDTKGKFDGVPGFQVDDSMPMLELANAFTVTDGPMFAKGMSECLDAVDELIVNVVPIIPQASMLQNFRVPRPTAFPNGNNGTMYSYPIFGMVERNFSPHAIVTDKLIILATHQSISQRMASGKEGPTNDVIKLDAPSGDIVLFQLEGFASAVKEWIRYFEKDAKGPFNHIPKDAKPLVKEGIDLAFDLLSTFKGLAVRTYKDGDYVVTHAWFHMEDLKN